MDVERPESLLKPLVVTRKTLMGPGPSNCSPRVLHALAQPIIGHFHNQIFQVMDEIKSGIQYIFQTKNAVTLAVSASGHGGMDTALSNLVEPGDKVLVAVNGIWGTRAMDMAARYGGCVESVEVPPGDNFSLTQIEEAMANYRPALFFITQGESSTGVYQPVEGIGDICRRFDCLLVVDTVASLGGVPVLADRWNIDCIYTGSQKVLGAPPGLAPISFSDRAVRKILRRTTPPRVYYFDITLLGQYWNCFPGQERIYHHTISPTLLYGLREGIAQIVEEGIDQCIQRHQKLAARLQEGLQKLGFKLFVEVPSARLPTVTTVKVKAGMNWKALTGYCLDKIDVEISGGLGPTVGKVLRIGLMGYNATDKSLQLTLSALEQAMRATSFKL